MIIGDLVGSLQDLEVGFWKVGGGVGWGVVSKGRGLEMAWPGSQGLGCSGVRGAQRNPRGRAGTRTAGPGACPGRVRAGPALGGGAGWPGGARGSVSA